MLMLLKNSALLSTPSQNIPPHEIRSKSVQRLIDEMINTMDRTGGVGLAAPQVRSHVRIFVACDTEKRMAHVSMERRAIIDRYPFPLIVAVNPVLTVTNPTPIILFEGCLSIVDSEGSPMMMSVRRALSVRLNALDRNGNPIKIEAQGWPARILQHEYDHLEGITCDKRAPASSIMSLDAYNRDWANRTPEEVARAFPF